VSVAASPGPDPTADRAASIPAQAQRPVRFDALSSLEHHATRRGATPAVWDDGATLTFDHLLGVVRALIGDLLVRGIQPGDVVAVALPNVWRYVALEIAVPALGAVLLPLPPRLGVHEVESALERTAARLLVVDTDWLGSDVVAAAEAHPTVVLRADDLPAGPRPAPAGSRWRRPQDPDRIVQIALTSGTTGLPKLASLSARLKQLTFEGFTARLGLGPGDRMLPMSPVTQGVGEMCLYALRTGATLIMSHEPRFDPDAILALIGRSRATVLGGVPTMLSRLVHAASLPTADLTSLRATITAGAALAPEVAEAWELRSRSATCSFYGAMDIGQLAVPQPDDDPPHKRWTTVGRPHDTAQWRIADPATGAGLPRGEVGDVCMRGPLVQDRYWGEEHGPYGPDGWAHFGDLGFVDEDGYLHLVGRIKDTIIRGGNNINPLEVEQALRTHPAVADACVIGAPDADLGERAVAFVVTAAPEFDVAAAAEHLGSHGMARYKWPETVVRVDALPLGSTGKVDRRSLRRSLSAPSEDGDTHADR
jgi:acyl-CoA synthetase (AMP-forming)/AMP-acid ligase II